MLARLKIKIQNAHDNRVRQIENERINRLQALKAQEVMSQKYRSNQEKHRITAEAAASLKHAVDRSDINEITRIVQQFGHDSSVMNALYQDFSYLESRQPGYSDAVDTVLIRALKRSDLDAVRILMQADAINPNQRQAWHYVTITARAVWRGCILDSESMPKLDPNHHKIFVLTAKQYAATHCPQAIPLLIRRKHDTATHSPVNTDANAEPSNVELTTRDSYSEFLLWKKQHKEAAQQASPVYTKSTNRM